MKVFCRSRAHWSCKSKRRFRPSSPQGHFCHIAFHTEDVHEPQTLAEGSVAEITLNVNRDTLLLTHPPNALHPSNIWRCFGPHRPSAASTTARTVSIWDHRLFGRKFPPSCSLRNPGSWPRSSSYRSCNCCGDRSSG